MKGVLLMLMTTAQAEDLGSFGQTFAIKERDLIEVIQAKLQGLEQSGQLAQHQQKIQAQAKAAIERPQPVKGITKTKTPRQFTYDPTITVPYDLKDHQGQVFHRAGTKVNPLTIRPLTKPLLLIDGDDEAQVHWALHQYHANSRAKIILVKGAPLTLTATHDVTFYFDQGGQICQKLHITEVPARVTQQDDHLLIECLVLDSQEHPFPSISTSGEKK